jgi:TetR/AcrR family transcriptional repressor of nem operon
MTKGAETKQDIVRHAATLFNQKGFEGTALSDLMQATGLKKGGIYRHFESKEQLASEAFDYAWRVATSVRQVDVRGHANSLDQLKQMVRNFAERREGLVPGGCPLLNTAIDSDDGNPTLRARARKAMKEWLTRLRSVAEEGIERGDIQKNVNPQKLSALIAGTLEGALMMSRLNRVDEPLHWACEHLESHLEGLRQAHSTAKRRASRP